MAEPLVRDGAVALDIVVLNLDRSAARWGAFQRDNPRHKDIVRFSAIDGRAADRARLIADGVLRPGFAYPDGALGNALSHIAQWRRAAAGTAPLTVLEDDAVLCANFRDEAARLLAQLPPDWDYVQWGYNFDTFLTYRILPGLSPCVAIFDQDRLRTGIGGMHRRTINSMVFPLVCSLGIPAYTVSPKGAQRLLAGCLPLRQARSFYPGLNQTIEHRSIDFMLNTLHPAQAHFVAVPPLAVTANDLAISTVSAAIQQAACVTPP